MIYGNIVKPPEKYVISWCTQFTPESMAVKWFIPHLMSPWNICNQMLLYGYCVEFLSASVCLQNYSKWYICRMSVDWLWIVYALFNWIRRGRKRRRMMMYPGLLSLFRTSRSMPMAMHLNCTINYILMNGFVLSWIIIFWWLCNYLCGKILYIIKFTISFQLYIFLLFQSQNICVNSMNSAEIGNIICILWTKCVREGKGRDLFKGRQVQISRTN